MFLGEFGIVTLYVSGGFADNFNVADDGILHHVVLQKADFVNIFGINQRGQAHLFTQYPRNTQRDSVKMDATAAWHARILPNNSSLAP